MNMLHWLHSLLPHIPRYGFVFVFIVIFLSNVGVPMPGKTILFGAGFVLGKTDGSLWPPMAAGVVACFLGGIFAFWLGRHLDHGRLEKVPWLHLTPEKLKWPEAFFKRHGPKAMFFARFIPLFPPVLVNLLAGMAKMRWQIFLCYNLANSIICGTGYIVIGYFLGKKCKLLETWLGPATLYLVFAGLAVGILIVIFRHSLSRLWARVCPTKCQ